MNARVRVTAQRLALVSASLLALFLAGFSDGNGHPFG